MHSLGEIHEKFRHDWRNLQNQWQWASDRWRDEKKHQFEQQFWRQFEEIIPATLEEIDNLHQFVLHARREVP